MTASTQTATGPQQYIMFGAAVPVRAVRSSASRRPRRLLDHDQPLDARPAGGRADDHADADSEPTPRSEIEGREAASAAAAQEEEDAAMSELTPMSRELPRRSRPSASARSSSAILDALDLEAEVEVEETDDEIVGRDRRARTLGLLIGRRGQTIDARAAALLPGRLPRASASASGSSSTPPATASAAARRSSARPTAPPSGRSRRGKEIELEPMTPTERRVVHEHLKDRAGRRDLQRGRRARALRDRRARCVGD